MSFMFHASGLRLAGTRACRLLAAVLLTAVCSGCMWGRMRVNDPTIVERAERIKPGVTKVAHLSQILGAEPTMRMPVGPRLILGYTYADTKSNGLVLILLNFSRSQTVTDTLYVEADAETGTVVKTHIPPEREIEWRFWPFGDD